MALCSGCGAPLKAGSVHCNYCGNRNEVDFVYLREVSSNEVSPRMSPITGKPMRLVRIETDGETIEVDQCPQTGGIWFDHGELEYLLTHQIKSVLRVDEQLLTEIKRDRVMLHDRGYIPCPDCADFMPTKQYQQGSGVIIDWCRHHGIWLDGGELAHLIEWARAGGLVKDRNAIARHQVESIVRQPDPPPASAATKGATDAGWGGSGSWAGDDTAGRIFTLGGERKREPGVSIFDAVLRLFDLG